MNDSAKAAPYWNVLIKKPSKPVLLVTAVSVAALIAYFKVKPYIADNPKVTAFAREGTRTAPANTQSKWDLGEIWTQSTGRKKSGVNAGQPLASRNSAPRVLERPIFDGKNVVLRVRLTTELDSTSGDPTIEGIILGALEQNQSSADSISVKNSVIRGTVTPNFEAKRYMAQFSEILTTEGKAVSIAGVAFNPDDSSLGIPSEYSSGLPSRLFGGALNRVIVAADQVAESHVLENGEGSAVDRELSRVARQGSSEAANGIGDEATKSLRETKPILKVKAGSVVFVKMQSARRQGGQR